MLKIEAMYQEITKKRREAEEYEKKKEEAIKCDFLFKAHMDFQDSEIFHPLIPILNEADIYWEIRFKNGGYSTDYIVSFEKEGKCIEIEYTLGGDWRLNSSQAFGRWSADHLIVAIYENLLK